MRLDIINVALSVMNDKLSDDGAGEAAGAGGSHGPQSGSEPEKRTSARPLLTLQSAELLQGHSEVWIQHGDEMYRLRQTRNGKLILNK